MSRTRSKVSLTAFHRWSRGAEEARHWAGRDQETAADRWGPQGTGNLEKNANLNFDTKRHFGDDNIDEIVYHRDVEKFSDKEKSFNKRLLSLPGIWGTVPSGLVVGVDLIDDFFPPSSGFFLPPDELSDPGLRGDFLPSTPFSRGEWWFPLLVAPDSLASSTTRSASDFSPSEASVSRLIFLWSGEPGLSLRSWCSLSLSLAACCSPGLRELLWKRKMRLRLIC